MGAVLVTVVSEIAAKCAAKLVEQRFGRSRKGQQQRALSEAIKSALFELVQDEPNLGDISFFEVIHDDAVTAELGKVFDPDDDPDPSRFRIALEAKYDCETLPLAPEVVFERVVAAIRQLARTDPVLQPLAILKGVERTAAAQDTIVQQMARQEDIHKLAGQIADLSGREAEIHGLRSVLDADYAADIEKARHTLNASRFVDARSLLEGMTARPGFGRMNAATRGETYRLLGLAHMRLGDGDRARECLTQALIINPEDPKAQVNLAELEVRTGRLREARKAVHSVLARDPTDGAANRILAVAHLHEGSVSEARKRLSEIGDSDDFSNLSVLARCDAAEGRYRDAAQHLERVLEAVPDDPVILLQKGAVQLEAILSRDLAGMSLRQPIPDVRRVELMKAHSSLARAVEVWDDHGLREYSADARAQLAVTLSLLGEHDTAIRAAREATSCKNADARAWVILARCQMDANDLNEAEESANHALTLQHDMPAATTLLSLIKARGGKYLEALGTLDQAPMKEWPEADRLSASILRADLLWDANERERALALVMALPAEVREQPFAVARQADYLVALGRAEDAREIIASALDKWPKDPMVLHAAGEVQLAMKDAAAALRSFAKAVRLAPNARSVAGLGWTLLRLGRPTAVLKVLDHFEGKGVHADELLAVRGAALYDLGQFHEAAETYDHYLVAHPRHPAALQNAAVCRMQLGHRRKAIELLQVVAELAVSDWRSCAGLAELYITEGDRDAAFRWARDALTRGPDQPETHLLYIRIALETGHGKDAAPVMSQLVERFPDFPHFQRKTLAEGLELIRDSQRRADDVTREYLAGRLPIALAADVINKPLALLRVLLRRDSAGFIAEFGDKDGQESALTACQESEVVVIDYPALITLAQCETWDLARCFSRVCVPAKVRTLIQIDRMHLSERLAYLRERRQRAIHDRLAPDGVLERWKEIEPDLARWPLDVEAQHSFLCERAGATYLIDTSAADAAQAAETSGPVLTTQELVEQLWSQGRIARDQYSHARGYLTETGNWDIAQTSVSDRLPECVLIDASTLFTLEVIGLLDWVLINVPRVYVSPYAVFRLNTDVMEEEVYKEALSLVEQIEVQLDAGREVFVIEGSPAPNAEAGDLLASIGAPVPPDTALWSDDLVTKMVRVRAEPGARVFSTRTVLDRACEVGIIDADRYHRTVLRMMHAGFSFCWFKGETLVWSLDQRNYQTNEDTDALLKNRGNPDAFEVVVAFAIAKMAERHDACGAPTLDQLQKWMEQLGRATADGFSGVMAVFVKETARLLSGRSLRVQSLWKNLVLRWASMGFIKRQRGRIYVPRLGPVLWRPDQGTRL